MFKCVYCNRKVEKDKAKVVRVPLSQSVLKFNIICETCIKNNNY